MERTLGHERTGLALGLRTMLPDFGCDAKPNNRRKLKSKE